MASFLDTLFGGGAQQDAANANAIALQNYQGTALPALATGYGTATGAANQAVGAYAPLATLGAQYGKAGTLALGALGAGGPQGTADAAAAFTNAPGYTGAVTAGTDAILRQLGASGMSQSGNAAEDVGTFTQNLQNQQYNTWLQNLLSAGNTGVQATGAAAQGQAAGYGTLANLATQYGEDQSGIASGVASGTMADNNMVAAGQAAGAKNLLGAGLSLATLGMGGNPFGGSLTGGSSGGGTSLFGQIGQGLKLATGYSTPSGL
jgi:hypothetical protein